MQYKIVPLEGSVFRAYDIRGIVGEQLNADALYTLGLAIGSSLLALQRTEVCLGRDGRLSSDELAIALRTGLIDRGIHVKDLGAVATPVMYYATHTLGLDSGLMVTGSHNPSEYNGVKLVLAGKSLVQVDMDALYEQVMALQNKIPTSPKGTWEAVQLLPDYMQRMVRDIKLSRPLKVVVDCGNGIVGPIVPQVLRSLGCEVIPLYCEVDGRFPHHHPDPTVEANLVDLRETVLKTGADLGLGFDGDADRLGVVTNTAEIIWPDRLMLFYVNDLLERYPGAAIVFDVKCSKALAQGIVSLGGTPHMCPTGHSIVKGVMKTVDAPLAGEMSGHLFFKDRWYGFDDALYSACRLLELLSQQPMTVSEQFAAIPKLVSTPEIKIPISDLDKFEFMRRFVETANFKDAQRIAIDGLRVEFEQGWGLLRASNTTPCLVARFEAQDQATLTEIQDLFKDQLLALDAGLSLPW